MKIKTIILASCVSLLLVACSKLSNENYQRIEMGQDFSEIETLLGTPSSCQETMGLKQCQWGNEQRNIDVKFVADKVTYFSKKGLK
ncbi:MAG: DUF3862 domain-containing protein [Psychrobium sp.]|nr:DUF3862 domain-containing protein [Psychrobium sp.]